jgi:arylsulfatase A-like enzyme
LKKFAHISQPNRRTYAAMVAAMDDVIGQLMLQLEASQQRENTLIFFVSDNGGPNLSGKGVGNFTDNTPLRGAKGDLHEGGMRVPFLISWPARLKPGTYDAPVISLDFLPTAIALAGGKLPEDRTIDGVNLMPYLTGEKPACLTNGFFGVLRAPKESTRFAKDHGSSSALRMASLSFMI